MHRRRHGHRHGGRALSGGLSLVWRFAVAPGRRARFEAAYGPAGAWAQLFGTAPGFLGVELLSDGRGSYLTIDRWDSAEAHDAFMGANAGAYRALDAALEGLADQEERLGAFTAVG